jgi:cytochrome c biogenesis protein CcmG, thiol:disulfide interchange protein DsbE
MLKLSRHGLLIVGILSPFLALILYVLVYNGLLSTSKNVEQDWLFRLSISSAVMFVPFMIAVALAIKQHKQKLLNRSGMLGLAISTLSLMLVLKPMNDGITRWKQTKNMAMHDVDAPLFDTTDLSGNEQRLADQKGKVVLVNIWATWCPPCLAEMPKLDRLYHEKKDQGFVVYGISDEDANLQRKFLQRMPVTYPLLTVNGTIPSLYRDVARYPAIFLVDRNGKLQPAPSASQPFDKIEATVTALLQGKNPAAIGRAAR